MTDTISPQTTGVAARAVDATKIYGEGEAEVRALDGVSVEFESARMTAIMGPSGSGKSTLLHCMAGLDRLTSGQIFLGDADLSALNEKQLTLDPPRQARASSSRRTTSCRRLNALENITLPMSLAGNKPDPAWLDTVVNTVRLGDRLNHRPSELSGGQQQRVAVARALLSRPEIVFADEPTGNLDSRSGAEILTFMRQAVDDLGQTIVMVTHDPIAAGYADRVVFLADGKIVDEMLDPTADRVLDRMKSFGGADRTAMWRVTLKGLLAKKLRLVLTSIAVVLGVAFMSGTFVLTDTLGSVFDDLFSQQTEDIDAVVRARQALSDDQEGGFDPRNPVPEELLADGRRRRRREGRRRRGVRASRSVVGRDGDIVQNGGRAHVRVLLAVEALQRASTTCRAGRGPRPRTRSRSTRRPRTRATTRWATRSR